MLDDRAKLLLKALVERYIADGQPVGSRTLSKASGLELSPATIRNVMSDLEELGLIASPHTSAGRIPTARGYRLFVDTMLTVQRERFEAPSLALMPAFRPPRPPDSFGRVGRPAEEPGEIQRQPACRGSRPDDGPDRPHHPAVRRPWSFGGCESRGTPRPPATGRSRKLSSTWNGPLSPWRCSGCALPAPICAGSEWVRRWPRRVRGPGPATLLPDRGVSGPGRQDLESRLFHRDLNLFDQTLDVVFIDTTSLYCYRDTETEWRSGATPGTIAPTCPSGSCAWPSTPPAGPSPGRFFPATPPTRRPWARWWRCSGSGFISAG